MNGLDKIIQQIESKGERKEKSILKEAKEKAEKIVEEAEEEAESKRGGIIERGKEEADRIKRRKLASARREARQKKLEAREEIIQQALEKTKEELANIRGNNEEYKKILKDLIIAGGTAVGGGDLEASVLRNDKKMLSEKEIEGISEKISRETGNKTSLKVLANLQNVDGGTTVQRSDGSISCNNTFKGRLERVRRSLRAEIAGILFEN